jgi:hypothetical protein
VAEDSFIKMKKGSKESGRGAIETAEGLKDASEGFIGGVTETAEGVIEGVRNTSKFVKEGIEGTADAFEKTAKGARKPDSRRVQPKKRKKTTR